MIYKEVKLTGTEALRTRAAAILVEKANNYDATILIEYENKKINAKSIMGVLTLGVKPGESLFIHANGVDEQEAINGLGDLINNNFEI